MDERDVIRQKLMMVLQMKELQRTVQEHEVQLAAASTNIKHLRRLLAIRNPGAISKEMRKDNERKTKEIERKTKEIEQLKRAVLESKRKIRVLNEENQLLKRRDGGEENFDDEKFAQILVGLEAELVAKDNAIGRMKRKLARHNIEWHTLDASTMAPDETTPTTGTGVSEQFITDSSQSEENDALMSAPVPRPKQRKKLVKRVAKKPAKKQKGFDMHEVVTDDGRHEDEFGFGDAKWASDAGMLPRKQKVRKLQLEVAKQIRSQMRRNVMYNNVKFCGPSSLIGGEASDSDSESDDMEARIARKRQVMESDAKRPRVARRRSASPRKDEVAPAPVLAKSPPVARRVARLNADIEKGSPTAEVRVKKAGLRGDLEMQSDRGQAPKKLVVRRSGSPRAKEQARGIVKVVKKRKGSPRSKEEDMKKESPQEIMRKASPLKEEVKVVKKRRESPRKEEATPPKKEEVKVVKRRNASPRAKEEEQKVVKRKPSPRTKGEEQKVVKRKPSPRVKDAVKVKVKPILQPKEETPKASSENTPKPKLRAKHRPKNPDEFVLSLSTTEQSTDEPFHVAKPEPAVQPKAQRRRRSPSPRSSPRQDEPASQENRMWRKPAPMAKKIQSETDSKSHTSTSEDHSDAPRRKRKASPRSKDHEKKPLKKLHKKPSADDVPPPVHVDPIPAKPKSPEHSSSTPEEPPKPKSPEQPKQKPLEEPRKKSPEQPKQKPLEEPKPKSPEQPKQKPLEQPRKKSPEQSKQKPLEEPKPEEPKPEEQPKPQGRPKQPSVLARLPANFRPIVPLPPKTTPKALSEQRPSEQRPFEQRPFEQRPHARTLQYGEPVIQAPLILRRRGPTFHRPPTRLQQPQ